MKSLLFIITLLLLNIQLLFSLKSINKLFKFKLQSTNNQIDINANSLVTNEIPTINTEELVLKSPSKINLFLRILGRRPNGYHDLASLFQAISLSDKMTFSKLPDDSTSDELICSDKTLAIDKSNLVIKALDLMRSKTGINQYFKVYLDKIVPIQAGLGGGSGNAATAMHAFNVLTNYTATLENLLEWSGEIGSDITFFFSTGTAYCTGRGEIISPLAALPDQDKTYIHLLKPKQGLSTALVFKTLNLERLSKISPSQLLDIYSASGSLFASKFGGLINDLEPPAFQIEPILLDIKNDLIKYNEDKITGAMMSGSGTSIYAISPFEDININDILIKYPDLQYYKSRLINKVNNNIDWY